jgi:hypothetical protein
MNTDGSSVAVFSGSRAEASMVLPFPESNDISARLEDEYTGTTDPYTAAAGGAGAVKVAVAAEDAASAKELLANRRGGA